MSESGRKSILKKNSKYTPKKHGRSASSSASKLLHNKTSARKSHSSAKARKLCETVQEINESRASEVDEPIEDEMSGIEQHGNQGKVVQQISRRMA